jgi:hypothetical protein
VHHEFGRVWKQVDPVQFYADLRHGLLPGGLLKSWKTSASKIRFELWTSQIRNKGANHSTTTCSHTCFCLILRFLRFDSKNLHRGVLGSSEMLLTVICTATRRSNLEDNGRLSVSLKTLFRLQLLVTTGLYSQCDAKRVINREKVRILKEKAWVICLNAPKKTVKSFN